jgi:hypothetical protein
MILLTNIVFLNYALCPSKNIVLAYIYVLLAQKIQCFNEDLANSSHFSVG